MLRFLGAILFIVGLLLVLTIILWFIGVWFMLFGVLLLIFGGGRRVVVHHHRDPPQPRRDERSRSVKAIAPARQLRADAADNFTSAVLLYQKHGGHEDAASAIRELASLSLKEKGFLK